MPRAAANGIELEYDVFGPDEGRVLLLIMGLGAQMTLWDEEFCELLGAGGHRVLRFDNRDVGLSTRFHEAGLPDLGAILAAQAQGRPIDPSLAPYTLADMADDAVGLLDALGIERAHLCGASMGGMIAQSIAIRHPKRTRSLISIMSTTGDPATPPPSEAARAVLLTPPAADRESHIERIVQASRVIGSPGFPVDEARLRERAGRTYDRSSYGDGSARQLAAISASGSRVEELRQLATPTLVIHGTDDPLVRVEAGRDTARCIPGAELLLIDGMGHDLPPSLFRRLADAISEHTRKAESPLAG